MMTHPLDHLSHTQVFICRRLLSPCQRLSLEGPFVSLCNCRPQAWSCCSESLQSRARVNSPSLNYLSITCIFSSLSLSALCSLARLSLGPPSHSDQLLSVNNVDGHTSLPFSLSRTLNYGETICVCVSMSECEWVSLCICCREPFIEKDERRKTSCNQRCRWRPRPYSHVLTLALWRRRSTLKATASVNICFATLSLSSTVKGAIE